MLSKNESAVSLVATKLLAEVELRYSQLDSNLVLDKVRISDRSGALREIANHEGPISQFASFEDSLSLEDPESLWNDYRYQVQHNSPREAADLVARMERLPTIATLLSAWRARVFRFETIRTGTGRSRGLRSQEWLSTSGDNLPEALLHLNTNRHPAWERIRSVMRDIVPDIGGLETPTMEQEVKVVFEDPYLNASQNMKDLGTGVEQLLMATYVGERHTGDAVVIVEEPENHLHPEAQRRLLTHLARWSADRLIVMSTHSPVFLDRTAGQIPIWLVQRARGVATIARTEPHLPTILKALGIRISDVLTAESVLVVEGESDLDVLRLWYGPEFDRRRIRLVAGKRGGDIAFQVETFEEWIKQWLAQEQDSGSGRLRFLRDRDELPKATIERLQALGAVTVLSRRELENFLLDPAAIRSVLEQLSLAMEPARETTRTSTKTRTN